MPTSHKKKPIIHRYLMMVVSLIVASVLTVYPLNPDIAVFRPMWLAMALIFWLIFQPALIGAGIAFWVGLITDLLTDSTLGTQAVSAVLVAFFIKFISGYLRQLSAGKVWLLVAGCLFLYQSCLVLLKFFTDALFAPELFWTVLISLFVWPVLLAILARYTNS